jgi:Fibrobacter succinogenes major domain (Fib_succ_major).
MDKTKIQIGCLLIASLIMISSCGSEVKNRDGNVYKVVIIGKQKWMAENLAVNHFRNGDTIPEARSAEEWKMLGAKGKPAWCIEENIPRNGRKYGKLYNWYAVNDPRSLAPEGWHVPSDAEWTQLTDFLGGEIIAAIHMRTSGLTEKGKGSYESGFYGLPGGNRNNNGAFYGLGSYGYWWSVTEANSSKARLRILNYPLCSIESVSYNKLYGISVRCLRN